MYNSAAKFTLSHIINACTRRGNSSRIHVNGVVSEGPLGRWPYILNTINNSMENGPWLFSCHCVCAIKEIKLLRLGYLISDDKQSLTSIIIDRLIPSNVPKG